MFMVTTTHLRILFFTLLCSLAFYCVYPFVNGSGCDFHAETEDEFRAINMSCFAGVLTSVYHKKSTGDIVITKNLWGKRGGTVYLVNYHTQYEVGAPELRKNFLPSFISSHFFSSYKIFHGVDGKDVVISDAPVMRIYKLERVGELSWL